MHTAIICASGPSLTHDDCQKAIGAGLPVIAVNSSWRAVPGCSHIYAGDLRWWDASIKELPESAELWTCNYRAHTRYGLHLFETDTRWAFNSGQRSILFAASLGAKNIILLGFDCSVSGGSHWHGDHVGLDNPNAENASRWRGEFASTARLLAGKVNIINSSRQTALKCFRRLSLDEALREVTC
ncbi:hypothetical protein K6625_19985 [Escherichia coli]|uniref:hypothetical protein n=1 Tax=Escherichia coli TaxID=562 RepID=UPI0010AA7836|nr:hypothetical protein [Escherichia coli]EMB0570234.1 hypothetical protein [Escherichia coli]MBY8780397.1 hypothetical protein [Escherichia coli]MBZ2263883.1 hypothetical protein [Escherichia coli]MBZ2309837.1 hypothetical protein [Escherichia coli]MBZ2355539.1 hypothetical protein [Escherichia coli]